MFKLTHALAIAAFGFLPFVHADAAANPRGARDGAQADTTPSRQNASIPSSPQLTGLNEGFDDITTLAGNGWSLQNLSTPVGSTNWFQGNNVSAGGPFDSFDGAANAYIGANYNNTGSTGTISNWMMTPMLDFGSGAVLTFYTRKASPDTYADRLEVRLSTNGASTNAGTNATTVGDFTTVELSINPTLVLGVYPTSWTQYTISGLPHSGTGRIGFRYYVTGGGFSGTSSDYIGIDRIVYAAGTPEYLVGGSVNGLSGGGLTLQLNGANDLAIGVGGSFQFPPYITEGGAYAVTVGAQPTSPNQTCLVSNGSGTVSGSDVSTVSVDCTTNTYSVGGAVSGLLGSGLVLHLDNGDDVPVAADGSFTFPNSIADGTAYTASVGTQPSTPNQVCTIANDSGVLGGGDVTNIAVTCVTSTYLIGGTIVGLDGSGLTLQLNGADDLSISADGAFSFGTPLADGSPYLVTVSTQPSGGTSTVCIVNNGIGTLAGAPMANVEVTCDIIFIDGFDGL